MESGAEVLRAVAAIVSTFQSAADTLEVVKDRREKKKRKKDKEVEELFELKMLHRSLVEGGTKCRKHCENRHQQFGPAFETGDAIAVPALKDVVIALQTEVIQALHLARAVENAVLDFTSLYESSVTSRKDATRAMDQLCQRLMASMQFQPQHGENRPEATSPSNSSMRSGFASMRPSELNESCETPLSPPTSVGSPGQTIYQRALPPLPERTVTIRRPGDMVGQLGKYSAPQTSSPQVSPQDWPARMASLQGNDPSIDETAWSGPSSIAGEEQMSHQDPDDSELERRSLFSIQDSALGSFRVSKPLEPADTTSTTTLHEPRRSSINDQVVSEQTSQPSQPATASMDESASIVSEVPRRSGGDNAVDFVLRTSEAEKSSSSSLTTVPRPSCTSRINGPGDLLRALEAPEVVPRDFEGLTVVSSHGTYPEEKILAFRTQSDYADTLYSLSLSSPGMENIWMPLTRPAMHNRYHGFCKGAWQIRKEIHEGLEIQMTPNLKDPVIHWACKVCKFRSKAPNADALPDQILFNQKYGVRYRWLFLAKSHRSSESSSDMADNYQYGCMFCAAQGQTTAVHEKLDHLMFHIVSKHRTTMLTPEIKQKTKCIVGGVPTRAENWDINVPVSNPKAGGVSADEFFISASKFLKRRKKRA